MELLYVVELDVRASGPDGLKPAEVHGRVLEHVAEWLSFEHSPQLATESFRSGGTATLLSERDDRADTRVSWSIEGTVDVNALVVTVRSEITASGRADFICVVTVLAEGERIAVRLELGRESLDGVLAPAGIDFFRRPYLLVLLLRSRFAVLGWSQPRGRPLQLGQPEACRVRVGGNLCRGAPSADPSGRWK